MSGSREKEKGSGLSESFIIGVIAIVFLVVGYQTALFVHQASIMKITANRDKPDTVYVYSSQFSPSASSGASSSGSASIPSFPSVSSVPSKQSPSQAVRKNSEHSRHAQSVRANVPRSAVESFRFNPNTVSVDELCRLGFSLKQAQSIDNYRKKGGRFRRKEDFAKSYVVADSVYSRLESYIDIPLVDLNLADSAAFDALPGIGGWFAAKIIEHRKRLGGYSYKEQLMDIYNFTQEKYDALSDLVTVLPETSVPYPLWSLPADSLRSHPYINNYETAHAIVLFRESNPPEECTVDALASAGILSPEMATKLSRCIISMD